MSLYVLGYVQNMEFRGKLTEFEKIPETINMLKEYDINVSYITKVKEDDSEVKRLLGIYNRTKKYSLRNQYINDIEHVSHNLGNKPITVDEFLKKEV